MNEFERPLKVAYSIVRVPSSIFLRHRGEYRIQFVYSTGHKTFARGHFTSIDEAQRFIERFHEGLIDDRVDPGHSAD